MALRRKRAVGAVLAAVAVTLAGCAQDSDNAQNAVATGGNFEFITPGGEKVINYEESERKPLRTFSGEDVRDTDKTISLEDYDGEIVVLNSWGQWCAPCRSEADDLQEVHSELQKRQIGTVLGINVRDYNPQVSNDFLEDNGLKYPSIYDPPFKTAAALGGVPTSVVPTTIVLDKQHRPATVFLRSITAKDVLDVVDKLEKE
ncbi:MULTISPECIES: TlpA disulfide reductase family protein [Corynebacterium]|uniref:TlpA disulfide reductase family protein n=2 Tax=Corynebacteriaceae TaxID=1653 RepID=UPI00190779FC|nr:MULTISPECIES: TlpA disulfide reductase family protein [Corynebacterium]MCG7241812.1 TlpA family protein disulfide reductase [Corynebacterium kefirresidentii]MCG7284146.1 TlpA family protein disulfide reductase [Corynebacterium kefirresidentii]MDK8585705.1 TlpA disulfide reductase family protein [Corynebacterium kefirresidentii]MDN8635026.1 TlpA disulfide reductase family protein [Corynebacterium kefirresidentii]MDU4570213.1 TlpA disulfide reductase family protein [Corynebacterium sp.]